MGSGSFDANSYRAYSTAASSKPREEVFTSLSIDPSMDPKKINLRESRDSADSPQSTPLIVALDVTGSMGAIAEALAKQGIGTLFTEILARKPISDPHLMSMGIGDAKHDQFPLQVSQFEADNRAVEQLTKLYLEGGGGGNDSESYNFPWYFAANHIVHDSWEKRRKRGYLFTVGDERAPFDLTRDMIRRFTTGTPETDQASIGMLSQAERTFDVYHIIIAQGDYARRDVAAVLRSWTPLLGQRAIVLRDYTKLAETVVGAISIAEGNDHATATKGFAPVVLDAVRSLPRGRTKLLPSSR